MAVEVDWVVLDHVGKGAVDGEVGVHGADQDGDAQLPLVSNRWMHDGFPEQLGLMFQDGVDTDQLGGTSLNMEHGTSIDVSTIILVQNISISYT